MKKKVYLSLLLVGIIILLPMHVFADEFSVSDDNDQDIYKISCTNEIKNDKSALCTIELLNTKEVKTLNYEFIDSTNTLVFEPNKGTILETDSNKKITVKVNSNTKITKEMNIQVEVKFFTNILDDESHTFFPGFNLLPDKTVNDNSNTVNKIEKISNPKTADKNIMVYIGIVVGAFVILGISIKKVKTIK